MRKPCTVSAVLFALLLSAAAPQAAEKAPAQVHEFTILHFNDFHGRFEPEEKAKDPLGGAARLATVLNEAEQASARRGCDTFILFGGDAYSGSLISSEFKGQAERRFLNLVGVDAMVPGNHDFDYGESALRESLKASQFLPVCANLHGGMPALRRSSCGSRRVLKQGRPGADGPWRPPPCR